MFQQIKKNPIKQNFFFDTKNLNLTEKNNYYSTYI